MVVVRGAESGVAQQWFKKTEPQVRFSATALDLKNSIFGG